MEPLATLHHFVHPEWFEQRDAFEKEENIGLFLAWVRLAFECAHTPPSLTARTHAEALSMLGQAACCRPSLS